LPVEPARGGAGAAGDDDPLFGPIFTSDEVAAATGPEAWIRALLAFERELALAEGELGILSAESARAAADATGRVVLSARELGIAARSFGNPVAPLVRALVDEAGGSSAVHFGATSQDAMDTAAMLVADDVCRIVARDLGAAARSCAALAERHRTTLMTGRTLLQPAVPITFGLKAAGWLVALVEAGGAVDRVRTERLGVQLGGAAGTMAAFGDRGPELSAALAGRLGLVDPQMPWHTDRSRVVELAAAISLVANAAAKVALDVVLLAQAEVGEVREGVGDGGDAGGGSSTMPHKANQAVSVAVLAAARRVHAATASLVAGAVQDHERAATGGWHAEWQTLNDLLRAAGGCAEGAARVLGALDVDAGRMEENVRRTHGVLVAERVALELAPRLGRSEASALVGRASRRALAEGRLLRDELAETPEVAALYSAEQLDALCDPAGYLGAAQTLVDRALARHHEFERSQTERGEVRR
jgi:3-carboxy-cis,cis-muconate cycloisomerase